MPELPEVETIKRDLAQRIIGQKIIGVEVRDTLVVRSPVPEEFARCLLNQEITGVRRRAKAVIIQLQPGGFLVVQLGMTGQLIVGQKSVGARVIFRLSNGAHLSYNDQRRFGRLNFIDDLSELKYFQTAGVEPLEKEFSQGWLLEALKKKAAPIKSFLMNQHFIAGIGNIYASEILFRAKINPKKRADKLNKEQIKTLHQTTVDVLKEAIKYRGSSVNNYRDAGGQKGKFVNRIKVYGRENEGCFFCRAPIKRIVQAGRSTFFCQTCQE